MPSVRTCGRCGKDFIGNHNIVEALEALKQREGRMLHEEEMVEVCDPCFDECMELKKEDED